MKRERRMVDGCLYLYIIIIVGMRWRQKRKEGPDHHQSESNDDGEGSDNSARHEADEVVGAKEWMCGG